MGKRKEQATQPVPSETLTPAVPAQPPAPRRETRPQMLHRLPQRYQSPAHLEATLDAYTEQCKAAGRRPTWSGMALAIGYNSRTSLWELLTGREDAILDEQTREGADAWTGPLKRAVTRIEEHYERRLDDAACSGAIFALKQRGWTDRLDVTSDGGPLGGFAISLQIANGVQLTDSD